MRQLFRQLRTSGVRFLGLPIQLGTKVGGMIGAPHQRSAGNMAEALLKSDLLVVLKGVRVDVLDYRQMLRRGTQVLSER